MDDNDWLPQVCALVLVVGVGIVINATLGGQYVALWIILTLVGWMTICEFMPTSQGFRRRSRRRGP